MSKNDPVNWMLSEAIELLARAERLRQQFFSLQTAAGAREASWEPPIDVLETDQEMLIEWRCLELTGSGRGHHRKRHADRKGTPSAPPRTAQRNNPPSGTSAGALRAAGFRCRQVATVSAGSR